MTIVKTKTLVETYRAKASSKDINELTGRTGRPDLTKFVIDQMAINLPVQPNTILVDVGCGDGQFLLASASKGLNGYIGRLIGILPTKEEVTRVRNHLLDKSNIEQHLLSIEIGLAERTNLPDNFCDMLVCNGVLHGSGQTIDNVKLALLEFQRITKAGGTIFIGEMPDSNELTDKNYGDSVVNWLLWVFRNQGLTSFTARLKQIMIAFFTSEPFVITPKKMFFMPPNEFILLLDSFGIKVIRFYRHKEIDLSGNISESQFRWNYIAIKK